MMVRLNVLIALILSCMSWSSTAFAQETITTPSLATAELGSTPNVHSFGSIFLAGQPSADDFAESKRRGIKSVVTLRQDGEIDWDEAGVVRELGLEFFQIPFGDPESLNDGVFDETLQLLGDSNRLPVLLHCKSANRVGAIWLAHRVINDNISVKSAVEEAKTVGLRTAGYERKARDYVKRREASKTDASEQPSINQKFLDPALDVSEWLGRFEIESREVYAARERVLAACDIRNGMSVADIGAGTGFYARLFSQAVGDGGQVYAVDISAPFLRHIDTLTQQEGIRNMTTILCSERSTKLPPSSVDLVFVCDTYHHFEYHESTLASMYRALKPGGTLVVIDFERIPGTSREFIIGHVRAGKDVFRQEIVDAGFRFVEDVKVPSFVENYMLRFRKP